jgi:hypothetical protein
MEPKDIIPVQAWNPSVCTDSFNQYFSWNRKQAINPKGEKNIFNSKLEQLMACILLLINGNNTFWFGSLLIFLKFLSKQI